MVSIGFRGNEIEDNIPLPGGLYAKIKYHQEGDTDYTERLFAPLRTITLYDKDGTDLGSVTQENPFKLTEKAKKELFDSFDDTLLEDISD